MKKIEIKKGEKFGRLTVLEEIESSHFPNQYPRRRFLCRCECGKEKVFILEHLKSGRSLSCGCYRKEIIRSKSRYPEGFTKSRLYRIWSSIKACCKNKKDSTYGGRGITICEEWRNDFLNFYHWANDNGYKDTLTIKNASASDFTFKKIGYDLSLTAANRDSIYINNWSGYKSFDGIAFGNGSMMSYDEIDARISGR